MNDRELLEFIADQVGNLTNEVGNLANVINYWFLIGVLDLKVKEILYNLVVENDFSEDNYYHYEGVFLDKFYKNPMLEVIKDEPVSNPNIPNFFYAYLAATVHRLANKYGLDVPKWVYKDKYFLDDDSPYFQCNAVGDTKIVLILLSPPEFSMRNIFVNDTVLTRC